MDEKLMKAIEDFVTQRLDDLGTDAPEVVTDAITNVGCCKGNLEETLTEEQLPLWRELENALALQSGEEMYYYYRAGFQDAIHFLMDWSARI